MNHFVKKLLIIAIILAPFISFAHPGHGSVDSNLPSHYLTSPIHLIAGSIIGIGIGIVLWQVRKKLKAIKT